MGVNCVKSTKPDRPVSSRGQELEQGLGQRGNREESKENISGSNLNIKANSKLMTINPNEQHLYCMICKQRYGRDQRQPVKICLQQHTICSVCKDMLMATKVERYKVCPFCKRLLHVNGVSVNQELMALIK